MYIFLFLSLEYMTIFEIIRIKCWVLFYIFFKNAKLLFIEKDGASWSAAGRGGAILIELINRQVSI